MGIAEIMRPAVLFDRDGVLNRAVVKAGKPYPPASVGELEIIPEALALLPVLAAKYLLVAVTNQPDVARGIQSRSVVDTINARLLDALPLTAVLVCDHDDADNCGCRKPKPGLLLQAARLYDLDLSQSFMVGDRWKDIEAGHRAGCTTVFLDYHYAEAYRGPPADFVITSLAQLNTIVLT
jgi:D-glycero-D-manno-heptose 1,7-bisphosphate phosphatase